MGKFKVLLIAVFLFLSGSCFQQVVAQRKIWVEKETISEQEEHKLQEDIEQQKKAMSEQKRSQEEIIIDLKNHKAEIEDIMRDARIEIERAERDGENIRIIGKRGKRSFSVDEPFLFTPDIEPFYYSSFGGDAERTTWEFSKSVKESTFSRDYTFDVEKSVKTAIMSVQGDCKAGEIRIKILMPNGKSYSEIVIDEFGNLNWRKSFTLSETENQDKTGEWKFKIASSKATGHFKISLQTY